MTAQELRDIAIKKKIHFIPHHKCALCEEYVGWEIFSILPYEVVFNPSCGCGSSAPFHEDWQDIIDWITDDEGNLLEEYKWIEEENHGTT